MLKKVKKNYKNVYEFDRKRTHPYNIQLTNFYNLINESVPGFTS
jgi:hypothetical protein